MNSKPPKCTRSRHRWSSAHSIVGGCVENPGVWGNGGGIIIVAACLYCGCARETDTWPDGRPGRRVTYDPGRFADGVAEVRS